METNAWEEVELRRSYPATELAPRAARDAVAVVVADLPDAEIATGRLLVSELVSNSVRHGPSDAGSKVRHRRGGRAQSTPSRGVGWSVRQCGTPTGGPRRGLWTASCQLPFRAAGARAELAIST